MPSTHTELNSTRIKVKPILTRFCCVSFFLSFISSMQSILFWNTTKTLFFLFHNHNNPELFKDPSKLSFPSRGFYFWNSCILHFPMEGSCYCRGLLFWKYEYIPQPPCEALVATWEPKFLNQSLLTEHPLQILLPPGGFTLKSCVSVSIHICRCGHMCIHDIEKEATPIPCVDTVKPVATEHCNITCCKQ